MSEFQPLHTLPTGPPTPEAGPTFDTAPPPPRTSHEPGKFDAIFEGLHALGEFGKMFSHMTKQEKPKRSRSQESDDDRKKPKDEYERRNQDLVRLASFGVSDVFI